MQLVAALATQAPLEHAEAAAANADHLAGRRWQGWVPIRPVQIELKDLLSQDPADMKAVEAKVKQFEMMRTEMNL